MNTWKITWETFFKHSSRRSYAKELWRLSSIKLRVGFIVAALAFIAAISWVAHHHLDDWQSMAAILSAELFLFLIIEEMKGRVFRSEYGDANTVLGPPEKEWHRGSRFLMFKKKLTDASVTRDHVKNLFDLIDAKIDLENHRNETAKKFLIFASGVATASAVAWTKGLEPKAAIQAAAWFALFCAFIAPFLWVLPSRKERLKELKYFMLLYVKGNDL
ncbi:hypothetical protein [Stenotrophomonas sp. Sm10]|uniref:hypothetical protein n=1 Tax=Stenotrophomonas sp. Sm10 TaxID=3002754 RepID=UPI0027E48AA2|nr:hypothetical protein [Stenotrophomonas sp. Sm10]MDQ7310447.1 hypothetical protein [Stenotrophomonas sp. Sm10]